MGHLLLLHLLVRVYAVRLRVCLAVHAKSLLTIEHRKSGGICVPNVYESDV